MTSTLPTTKLPDMDISVIRKKIKDGDFNIVDHALTEAFKDGVSVNDIIYCINNGKVIESYPDRKRASSSPC